MLKLFFKLPSIVRNYYRVKNIRKELNELIIKSDHRACVIAFLHVYKEPIAELDNYVKKRNYFDDDEQKELPEFELEFTSQPNEKNELNITYENIRFHFGFEEEKIYYILGLKAENEYFSQNLLTRYNSLVNISCKWDNELLETIKIMLHKCNDIVDKLEEIVLKHAPVIYQQLLQLEYKELMKLHEKCQIAGIKKNIPKDLLAHSRFNTLQMNLAVQKVTTSTRKNKI